MQNPRGRLEGGDCHALLNVELSYVWEKSLKIENSIYDSTEPWNSRNRWSSTERGDSKEAKGWVNCNNDNNGVGYDDDKEKVGHPLYNTWALNQHHRQWLWQSAINDADNDIEAIIRVAIIQMILVILGLGMTKNLLMVAAMKCMTKIHEQMMTVLMTIASLQLKISLLWKGVER